MSKINKLKIGVLMAGKTIEREVSFNSARTVCDHIDTSRYDAIPIFQTLDSKLYILPWSFLYRGKISDFEHRLINEAKQIYWQDLKKTIDFIYIASHGHYQEDGSLQAMLEILNIPYLGSKVFASAISMDKILQKYLLSVNNIDIPKYLVIEPWQFFEIKNNIDLLINLIKEKDINFPLIVKPSKEGSSLGISFVDKKEDLLKAIEQAINIDNNSNQSILIEEYITGMEFSCIIITDYKNNKLIPLPPTEILIENNTKFFDYEQKYMPGRATKFTPARCSLDLIKKIQETCIKVTNILEIKNISRIDGFLTKDNKVVIIDPNTLSGMGPSSFIFRQAAELDMGHADLINHLIETELYNYNMLNKIEFSKNNLNIKNKRLKIAVFFGGDSNEKEISLESGRNIIYKLSPEKYESIAIFVNKNFELYKINQKLLVRNSTQEIESGLKDDMKISWDDLSQIADFVFIALHGSKGEDGTIQGALNTLSIPYNGSDVLPSAICMNKFKTTQILKYHNIYTPNNILISKEDFQKNKDNIINLIEKNINYPIIVKPNDDGCSTLVQKSLNRKDLENNILKIFNSNKNEALIEEYVQGYEMTVGVIGNVNPIVLPPSMVISSNGILSIQEKFLPGQGENQTPAPFNEKILNFIKKEIKKVYQILQCKGYARIDCFYQDSKFSSSKGDKIIIIEVNTLPALTPATCLFHQAAEIGIKPMQLIDIIIELGLQNHKKYDLQIEHNKLIKKDFAII